MKQQLGWNNKQQIAIKAPIFGLHQADNIVLAITVARKLGTPMELIKIRLQTANSNIGAMGVNSGLANLTAIGMFRGLGATCIRCGFGNAGFFAFLLR